MDLSSRLRHALGMAMRYGADLKTVFASIQGPKTMIIDETAGSGGDGRDPQLEKAIEVTLAELKKNPPVRAVQPPYPVRGKTQRGTTVAAPAGGQ